MLPSNRQDIRTLYITSLPLDVKEREIQILCRPFEGYEFCKIIHKNNQPAAFVKFSSRATALKACESLQDYVFDLNHPDMVIKVDFAKTDTLKKTSPSSSSPSSPTMGEEGDKKRRSWFDAYGAYGYGEEYGYPPYPDPSAYYQDGYGRGTFYGRMEKRSKGNTPALGESDTIFVGNLPIHCTESDLTEVFKGFPGFSKLRFTVLKNRNVCFVQFKDTKSAAYALDRTTGTKVMGNTLRIEYAQPSKDR
eukprot:TRINITY_DN23984_c0_g1_i1.p1 TRINITY_DN23984_c0_g1~~TRINITY_DN23984_c0_g1_i1.p1  ORF type:complete len:249 (-),score=17.42 TRINITY_DN23984_c0_g1_i1:118-864(-)